jgi:putative CocE/NonD family hydrolase
LDLFAIQREWFDRWLKSVPASPGAKARVTFFVMGENQWRNEEQWPPASLRMEKFYLASEGSANTRGGDGRLEKSAPVNDRYDEFSYDPLNPAPFLTDPGWIQLGGPDDYREVELREDVLVYSTPPLENELRITGPISVRLFAASSACDTDFTARLLDVFPDGYVMRLNDGIVRARFRSSLSEPSPIVPNRVYAYEIDCWATSHVFQRGHQVRIEISSSAFPRFDPNLNTGLPIGGDCTAISARQRIHHGSRYPSHVVLPIVES